jgi:RHH-type proline utilization regulon transcriptional repressor/proline dehydrogenase/delta 1-pyrroline-5-carboxylate dehydrogenase
MFTASHLLAPGYFNQSSSSDLVQSLWQQISPMYCVDESAWLQQLIPLATPTEEESHTIALSTTRLIEAIRADKNAIQMIDALLLEYSLDTQEGILLMCLAEALMRIPDKATADALIKDKLTVADWKSHLKRSDSVFVNASTWGLMLTGKVVGIAPQDNASASSALGGLVNKLSEPVVRKAMQQAMKIMGHQFVLGRTIAEAQSNGKSAMKKGQTYSYDMLGEAALTEQDSKKYYDAYLGAIDEVGAHTRQHQVDPAPSVSIKLSALHPRYEVACEERVMDELFSTLMSLVKRAIAQDVAITIDAEEADRLELSLRLFEKVYRNEAVRRWGKLGLVVQAYSKRALPVLAWLTALAKEMGDTIPVRLVKGAYWDSEIKWSQQAGYHNYPVFTRKEGTDVSYLACARFLLSDSVRGALFPQFASHNAHTVSAIASMAKHGDYEFQRLHGMGEALYEHAIAAYEQRVRIYAPVGSHKDLLPYLVRRLLENGANSSFVHRLVDATCPIEELTEHPVTAIERQSQLFNDKIPLPLEIFEDRKNSKGINIDVDSERLPFERSVEHFLSHHWQACSIVNGVTNHESMIKDDQTSIDVCAPFDRRVKVGRWTTASLDHVSEAFDVAQSYQPTWNSTPRQQRSALLEQLANSLEEHMDELVALCHMEAGKTIHDSIDEVREAVDFCRYYANQSLKLTPEVMASFDGTTRTMHYDGRGVFVCISPWNFPLAIFLGQISAALVTGNTVVAKPAEQTSLIAFRTVELMLEVGFPKQAIQLILGSGRELGQSLTSNPSVAGVAFTGSTQTAQAINRSLSARGVGGVPLIAETGGQNAMIVDSTALPEQVVQDAVRSAFASAGQRCSALRVLYVQEDIAPRIETLIKGAMEQLSIGIPYHHSTDVGPVIDDAAKQKLLQHIQHHQNSVIAQLEIGDVCAQGDFVPPTVIRLESIAQLEQEMFGPIMHIIHFKSDQLPQVVDAINQTGFGLTLGVHSRNETTYRWIERHARVGNCYINRDQVGAVVGVQPFGGQGLSGTGPKAGGPRYLARFSASRWQ